MSIFAYLRICTIAGLILLIPAFASEINQTDLKVSDNLYRVVIGSNSDAQVLYECGVRPLLKLSDGYLVMADDEAEIRLAQSGLHSELVHSNILREDISLDLRKDDYNRNFSYNTNLHCTYNIPSRRN